MVAFQMFPYIESCTVQSQCSGTWSFIITHLNASCDWFRQIGMGPRGWWVTFPVLFILGRSLWAQSGCVFREARFIAVMLYWMRFLSNNLAYFILPNSLFYSSWHYFVCICSFVYFCYWFFISSLNQVVILHCKWILIVMVLAVPFNHEHWGSLFMWCWPCILVIFDFMFQLKAPFVYYIFFPYSSTCFEQYCAHHQEELLYTHSIWFFVSHSS